MGLRRQGSRSGGLVKWSWTWGHGGHGGSSVGVPRLAFPFFPFFAFLAIVRFAVSSAVWGGGAR